MLVLNGLIRIPHEGPMLGDRASSTYFGLGQLEVR